MRYSQRAKTSQGEDSSENRAEGNVIPGVREAITLNSELCKMQKNPDLHIRSTETRPDHLAVRMVAKKERGGLYDAIPASSLYILSCAYPMCVSRRLRGVPLLASNGEPYHNRSADRSPRETNQLTIHLAGPETVRNRGR